MQIHILMVTWKWFKKNLNLFLFFFSMNNFTLKVLYLKKKKKKTDKSFSPISEMISIPWLVDPSQLCSAGRENSPLRSKAKKNLMHTPQTFLLFLNFLNTTLYIGQGQQFTQDARERNLSSECCQTWQDAEEWCICLMYLQRNENTITLSLFWALHFFSSVAWAVCDRIGSDSLNYWGVCLYLYTGKCVCDFVGVYLFKRE